VAGIGTCRRGFPEYAGRSLFSFHSFVHSFGGRRGISLRQLTDW